MTTTILVDADIAFESVETGPLVFSGATLEIAGDSKAATPIVTFLHDDAKGGVPFLLAPGVRGVLKSPPVREYWRMYNEIPVEFRRLYSTRHEGRWRVVLEWAVAGQFMTKSAEDGMRIWTGRPVERSIAAFRVIG